MKLNEIVGDDDPHKDIVDFLRTQHIEKFSIDKHGVVSVGDENVYLNLDKMEELPIKFGLVEKNFIVSKANNLTSLKGFPNQINGNLVLQKVSIKNLKGCTDIIEGNIVLRDNLSLTSLEGFPKNVMGEVYLSNLSRLTSLVGMPDKLNAGMVIEFCDGLTNLEGCPGTVKFNLSISNNANLVSTKGIAHTVGDSLGFIGNKNLRKFDEVPSKATAKELQFYFTMNKNIFIENVLSVLKIKTPVKVYNGDTRSPQFDAMFSILNTHLKTRDIIECQEELIEAGFKDYARLK